MYETWDLYKFPKSVFNILVSFQLFAERSERTLAGSFMTLVSTSPKSKCEKPEKAWVKEKPPHLVFGKKSKAVFSPNAAFFPFGRYKTHTSEKTCIEKKSASFLGKSASFLIGQLTCAWKNFDCLSLAAFYATSKGPRFQQRLTSYGGPPDPPFMTPRKKGLKTGGNLTPKNDILYGFLGK